MSDFEYQGVRRVIYGDAHFVPVCQKCGRFVKADDVIEFLEYSEQPSEAPNAMCNKCGRTNMIFEGFY